VRVITQDDLGKSKLEAKSQIDTLYSVTDLYNCESRKRSFNYYQWFSKKTQLIIAEPKYICSQEDKLIRGAVAWVEFGFNIGNEFGGRHPAIILRKTGQSIFVIPLSSQEPSEKKEYHVKIEKVYGFKNMVRWTNVLKLQNVSIQRVDFNSSIGNIKGSVLNDINDALKKSHIF